MRPPDAQLESDAQIHVMLHYFHRAVIRDMSDPRSLENNEMYYAIRKWKVLFITFILNVYFIHL